MPLINKITNDVLDKIINELKKDENQQKIHAGLVDPVICYIQSKLQPYIYTTTSLFILIILLMFGIILLLIFKIK